MKKTKLLTRSIYDLYGKEPIFQEAFHRLCSNIQFSGVDTPIKTIAITSAAPGEGKTTVAIGLAMAMAEAGKKTLILETDCRRPMLGNRLKLRPRYNWLNALYEDIPISEVVIPTKMKNLYFIDAEPQVTHLSEIFNSNRFGTMLASFEQEFDMIILDTPPLGLFIEAAVLANQAHGTVLVIHSGKVDIKREQGVINQLNKANARILGVVLNGTHVTQAKYEHYNNYKSDDKRRGRHAQAARRNIDLNAEE